MLAKRLQVTDTKSFVLEFSKVQHMSFSAWIRELSMAQHSAETLEKPEKYISISYRYNEHLTFAGTLDPAFLLVIVRMGLHAG